MQTLREQDMETVEVRLPECVSEMTLTGFDIAVTIFLLVLVTPRAFGPVVIVFVINMVVLVIRFLQNIFMKCVNHRRHPIIAIRLST